MRLDVILFLESLVGWLSCLDVSTEEGCVGNLYDGIPLMIVCSKWPRLLNLGSAGDATCILAWGLDGGKVAE
jgi:hypothetical protein